MNYKNMQRVSGAQVGKNAQKIAGCEQCSYMKLNDKAILPVLHKTGDACPKCGVKAIRVFDSKAEFGRAQELRMLNAQGFISDLKYQPVFNLHAPSFDTGRPVHICKYIADFSYNEPSKHDPLLMDFIVEDTKGAVISEVAVMKLRHFEAEYGLKIRIVQR